MNETIIPQQQTPARAGCLGEVGWFLSGFVLPLGSFSYYRKASQKSAGQAVLFFLLFTITASFFASIGMGVTLQAVGNEIRQSFEDGTVPEIVIRDGVAEVDGPQPVIVADIQDGTSPRTIVIIDTTGRTRQIDTSQYDQGFLLKERELHILNQNGRYQVLPLEELNTMFGTDTIVIDANSATRGWRVFAILFAFIIFFALILWNSVVRLMFISLVALVMWGVVSLFRPNTEFGPVIVSGIYSLVPAVYISHLFNRAGAPIPCLQTLLFLSAWILALFITFSPMDFFARERPARLWRAWLGAPFLLVLAVDLILTFQYGEIVSWALFILTGIALAIAGVFPLARTGQASPPEPPMASP
jgi:hypothetical protein